MRREDLGFVVSRGLAILLLTQALTQLSLVLPGFGRDEGSRSYFYNSLAYNGFLIGIAWLLWFRADAFAPKGPEKGSDENGVHLRNSLFACVGLYVLLRGLTSVGTSFLVRALFANYEPMSSSQSSWALAAAILDILLGGLVVLRFGGYLGTKRVRGLKERAEDLWRVGDPEEMKDE
jgi:hypothetical protein